MGTYLSSKLRDTGDGAILHWCPGCKSRHIIETLEPNGSGAIWTWDGNAEAPTFSPSINTVDAMLRAWALMTVRQGPATVPDDSWYLLARGSVDTP